MADNTIKIGGELESMATGKIVAAASAIKDKTRNKTQETINGDVEAAIAEQSAQFEALSEETSAAVASASQSARDAKQYLEDLQDAITELPDGQAVSAQVAVNQTDITGLKSKTDSISKQNTESEEEAIIFETDGGTQAGKIDANGADFADLKRGGQQVARMSDLPTKDSSIGENPSTANVPTTKAVKDYVDDNIPEVPDYPIETETAQSEAEEVIFGNDAGTQQYVKVSSEGVRAVAYNDMQGNNVIPVKDTSIGENPSQTNVPTSKAVADYVETHGGGTGDLPIEKTVTPSLEEYVVIRNSADTEDVFKVTDEGVRVKSIADMQGNPIKGGNNGSGASGIDGVGFLTKNNINDCDYCYICFYGQSFTFADDGGYKLTQSFDNNTYMYGKVVNPASTSLNVLPLSTSDGKELIASDAVDIISRLSKKYAHIKQDFIVGSFGRGEKSVLQLSKGYELNIYEDTYLAGITALSNKLASLNKTFNCPCIIYMQGESDTPSTEVSCNGDKELYKQRFLALKSDMQADMMAATGQTEPPVIMMYNVGGRAFNNTNAGISQAVLELAEEYDDIICLGPYYQVPDFRYHPTPDGRRWLAEIIAKVYCENFVLGYNNLLSVLKASCSGNVIEITFKNAVYPIVIDKHTVEGTATCGFAVLDSQDNSISITNVVTNGMSVYIYLASIPSGLIKIVYGGKQTQGEGNVRDSECWVSCYRYESNNQGSSQNAITYIPLNEDLTPYIGEKYPMWKWLPNMCLEINI